MTLTLALLLALLPVSLSVQAHRVQCGAVPQFTHPLLLSICISGHTEVAELGRDHVADGAGHGEPGHGTLCRGDAAAPASCLPPPLLPCSILALPALPVLPAVPFAQRLPAYRALLAPVPALHGDMGASLRWVASVNRVAHP